MGIGVSVTGPGSPSIREAVPAGLWEGAVTGGRLIRVAAAAVAAVISTGIARRSGADTRTGVLAAEAIEAAVLDVGGGPTAEIDR